MYSPKSAFLLTLIGAVPLMNAAGVGDAAAAMACTSFPAGAFKCLTDVSFVQCPAPGGHAYEQFVAAGTRCAQGIYGQKVDTIEGVVATTTRVYYQFDVYGKVIGSKPVAPSLAAPVVATSSAAAPGANAASALSAIAAAASAIAPHVAASSAAVPAAPPAPSAVAPTPVASNIVVPFTFGASVSGRP